MRTAIEREWLLGESALCLQVDAGCWDARRQVIQHRDLEQLIS